MPDPDARYASAAALHDDLERHLRSLPLRHVREPSLVERAAKWLRRHPGATSATGIASAAALLVGLMAAVLVVRGNRLAAFEASAALADFHNDFRAAQIACARRPERRPRAAGEGRRGLPQSPRSFSRPRRSGMVRRGRLSTSLSPGTRRGTRGHRRVALSVGRGDASGCGRRIAGSAASGDRSGDGVEPPRGGRLAGRARAGSDLATTGELRRRSG